MRMVIAAMLLVFALFVPTTVEAQSCRTHVWDASLDAGKTPIGFYAFATDGCNTVRWTSTIGPSSCAEQTFKMRTAGPIQPTEPGYTLPGPENGNYGQYRAAHEANLYFTHLFKRPAGTEVTVTFRCT